MLMIIDEKLITRLFISSPSSGMYKIEQRQLYLPAVHSGIYVNGVPTILHNGSPYIWIDKTEPIYRGQDKTPLLYAKITHIYSHDIRHATVQDNLREGYDIVRDFFVDWCTLNDPTALKNKKYGLAKLHKRPAELYQALVFGLRPIVDSVNMKHPIMKGINYDPDLPLTFHNYMPAMDTDDELMNFLFSEPF